MGTEVTLAEYYGVLSEETADELEAMIADRRAKRTEEGAGRARRIADALE